MTDNLPGRPASTAQYVVQLRHLINEWLAIRGTFGQLRIDHEEQSEVAAYNFDSELNEHLQGIGGVTSEDIVHMSRQISAMHGVHAVTEQLSSRYLPTLFVFRVLTLMEMTLRHYYQEQLGKVPSLSLKRIVDELADHGKLSGTGKETLHYWRERRNSLAHDATDWTATPQDVMTVLQSARSLYRYLGYIGPNETLVPSEDERT